MRQFHVQFCNERFLSRYGVDRILAIGAAHFKAQGAKLSFFCLRFDRKVIPPSLGKVSSIPIVAASNMQEVERQATNWVMTQWLAEKPDTIVVGGWPFFELAAKAPSVGVRSLFIDAGAVPHDGIPEAALPVQLELRRIRAFALPFIDTVLPISEYIRNSQTEVDRCSSEGVRTVPLGSDHLVRESLSGGQSDFSPLLQIRALKATGFKLVLSLGRFEEHGYKNSGAAFSVLKQLLTDMPKVRLLVFGGHDVPIPDDLSPSVIVLGQPDDRQLLDVMREVDVGISLSLWEGFNLPVVEMQEIGKPALAFNLAAHPEIIADPWFLCRDEADMVRKTKALLGIRGMRPKGPLESIQRFSGRMPWSATLASWWSEADANESSRNALAQAQGRVRVLMDMTNSARDSANSGVIRVARRLAAHLINHTALDVVLVSWDSALQTYTTINPVGSTLGDYGGPFDITGRIVAPSARAQALDELLLASDPRCVCLPILFLPEVPLDGSIQSRVGWARVRGLVTSAILHDIIPILYPQLCAEDVVCAFGSYLRTISALDQVLANSNTTLNDFKVQVAQTGAATPPSLSAVWLPSQFANHPRISGATRAGAGEIRLLCVSTIEPRKNHKCLLEAFEMLSLRKPATQFRLILVGNRYAGADELLADVVGNERVEWRGVLSDEALALEYLAARYTVYPSLYEGFGLPLMESLWMGRPCICASFGVMAELAQEGGCLTVDVRSPKELADAMERLAFDDALHQKLTQEAATRRLYNWPEYADKIARRLLSIYNPNGLATTLVRSAAAIFA